MTTRAKQLNPGKLLIYGAGGHGLVVAEAAMAAGWKVVAVLDDQAKPGQTLAGLPVLSPAAAKSEPKAAAIVAIGKNSTRRRVQKKLEDAGRRLACVIHPTAWVSPSAELGPGVYVGPMAVVNGLSRLGAGAIVNSGAVVEHHNEIGAFAHIGPKAALAGKVRVGALTLVGIGACVRPGIKIGQDCTIGAGAAIVGDVADGLTVVGVPGKKMAGAV